MFSVNHSMNLENIKKKKKTDTKFLFTDHLKLYRNDVFCAIQLETTFN